MVNGPALVVQQRKIEVPLTRVVTGVGVGLTEVAAEFVDESRNKPATDITAAQNLLPIIGTAAGIGLALTKNKTMRMIGNDMAVGYGAIATLKLGNIARSTITGRKLKKLKEISLMRGAGQVMSVASAARGTSPKFSQMSFA